MVVQGKGGATTGKLRSRASTPEECQSRTLVRLSRLRNRSGIPCRGAGHLLRRYPHVSIAFWPLGSSSFILHPCSSSLHCLSAFWPPGSGYGNKLVGELLRLSPLPFGVHCFPRTKIPSNNKGNITRVFIAFRRSLLSPHFIIGYTDWRSTQKSSLPFGVHCFRRRRCVPLRSSTRPKSSLPFGVHCFPRMLIKMVNDSALLSGLHCLSAFTAFPAVSPIRGESSCLRRVARRHRPNTVSKL